MENNPAAWEQAYRRGFADPTLPPHQYVAWLHDTLIASGVSRILDLGCGDGRHLAHFARLGYRLTGLDCSPTALRLACQRLGDERRGALRLSAGLVLGEMAALPFADGVFDAVVSFLVLNHGRISDIRRAIAEIGRVLTPGGQLFAVVSIWNGSGPRTGVNGVELEPATYLLNDHREAGIPHHFFLEEEFRGEFTGFEIERSYRDFRGRVCLLARRPG